MENYEDLNNNINRIKRDIASHNMAVLSLERELRDNREKICKLYAEEEPWKNLKGSFIEIIYEEYTKELKSIKGFYNGEFEYVNSRDCYQPILYKVKKDGTASKNRIGYYDLPILQKNVKSISKIE